MIRAAAPSRRHSVRFAIVVLAASVLAGCGDMPHTGPVGQGPRLAQDPLEAVPYEGQRGPRPDDSPEDLVRGFLRAMSVVSDGHQAAFDYLDPSAQGRWRSESQVVVYADERPPDVRQLSDEQVEPGVTPSPEPSPTGPGPAISTVIVRASQVAQVDRGRYRPTEPGTVVERRFGLRYQAGLGWRIATLAPGILVGRQTFAGTFKDTALYFPDRTRGYLVPDVRWFPKSTPASAATPIVEALLAGPADWLKPGVVTAVPPGTRLADSAVVDEDGTVAVALTREALAADQLGREIMVAQLRTTLYRASPSFQAVRVTVEGAEFEVGGVAVGGAPLGQGSQVVVPSAESPFLRLDPDVGVRPYLLDAHGRILRLESAEPVVVESVAGVSVPGARGFAVGYGPAPGFALLDAMGTSIVHPHREGTKAATLVRAPEGARLIAPSFDPQGWVWTVPTTPGAHPIAVHESDGVRANLAWLLPTGARVSALRMSRDGARMLVTLVAGNRWEVRIAAVGRDADGRPRTIGPLEPFILRSGPVLDLAWGAERTVIVLVVTGGKPHVLQATVGGGTTDLGVVDGAVSVAAVPSPVGDSFTVYAGTASTSVLVRQGATWRARTRGVLPRFPG